jgi:hypothetical protein
MKQPTTDETLERVRCDIFHIAVYAKDSEGCSDFESDAIQALRKAGFDVIAPWDPAAGWTRVHEEAMNRVANRHATEEDVEYIHKVFADSYTLWDVAPDGTPL